MYEPSEAELAWCAGFLDGEGSIGCYGNRGRWLRLQFTAWQTSREPLDRLVRNLGGSVLGPVAKSGRKPIWCWSLYGNEAVRRVALLLVPHMSVKREQVELALAKFDTRTDVRAIS